MPGRKQFKLKPLPKKQANTSGFRVFKCVFAFLWQHSAKQAWLEVNNLKLLRIKSNQIKQLASTDNVCPIMVLVESDYSMEI